MPMRWVEPELFLDHNGIKVYYTYKNDDPMAYWFTVDETYDDVENNDQGDEDGPIFDVRMLPTWGQVRSWVPEHERIKLAITKAIDAGYFNEREEN